MKKRYQNIINKFYSVFAIMLVLILWQVCSWLQLVPKYMLPSPIEVLIAFVNEFSILMYHLRVTLLEAVVGLAAGIAIGILIAVLMDQYQLIYKALYPLIIITQTVPTVAIAPLLVLWFGYGIMPKVVLIIIVTFFPITIGVFEGFQSVDNDTIQLLRSMGASKWQIFKHVKIKSAMGQFFASLRISASYSIVGAVIAEWLGGFEGLGVYMTRVKKSYAFDKMFAVIFLISIISLLLMRLVDFIRKQTMPWEKKK